MFILPILPGKIIKVGKVASQFQEFLLRCSSFVSICIDYFDTDSIFFSSVVMQKLGFYKLFFVSCIFKCIIYMPFGRRQSKEWTIETRAKGANDGSATSLTRPTVDTTVLIGKRGSLFIYSCSVFFLQLIGF